MAIRKKLNHDTKTREKIRTTQLIKRLEKHVFSEEEQGKVVELSATQITAALGLLKKSLPDLQAVEHGAGEGSGEITVKWKS